jgi:hypothetical protein
MRVSEMAWGRTAGHFTVRASASCQRTAAWRGDQRQNRSDGKPQAIIVPTSGFAR